MLKYINPIISNCYNINLHKVIMSKHVNIMVNIHINVIWIFNIYTKYLWYKITI